MAVKLNQLIVELFDRMLSLGVKQCVTTPTRSWQGQADSGLAHFYTNAPTLCTDSFRCRGTAWYENLPWEFRGQQKLGEEQFTHLMSKN